MNNCQNDIIIQTMHKSSVLWFKFTFISKVYVKLTINLCAMVTRWKTFLALKEGMVVTGQLKHKIYCEGVAGK